MAAMTEKEWLTPGEIARERRVSINKVLTWIHSGELTAVNYATHLNGERPRYRISRAALAAFDAARCNVPPQPQPIRKRRPSVDVPRYV